MEKHTLIPVTSRWLAITAVILLVLVADGVASQSDKRNNTLIRRYCSQYGVLNAEFFLRNLNTTLSSIRRQLANATVYHAVARTIINGESVYGLASCRQYLSNSECLKCLDTAAKGVRVQGLRYENNDHFYTEASVGGNVGVCGNQTSSQPTFVQTVKNLLSDLRVATPRRPDFYAASTRQVAGSNVILCLQNTNGRSTDPGCFMRYSNTAFFRDSQATDLTPFLKDGNSNTKKAIIGGVLGGTGLLFIVLVFLLWHQSIKSSDRQQGIQSIYILRLSKSTGATELLQGPITYSHNDLGTLNDGEVVAIKKATMTSRGRKTYFNTELKVISNVHHRYLLRFLGYCNKGPHLYLVLEFMENGSLDKFLYGEKRGSLMWKQSGFVAPEYASHGQVSEKVDTYSFGVLVLEIISGRRCTNGIENGSVTHNLIDYAWNLYENGMHVNLIDITLDPSEYVQEDVKKIIELSLKCTQSPASIRPSMSEAVALLSDRLSEQIQPMRSTFTESHVQIPLDNDTSVPPSTSNATA
ncbi:hypothetical protein L1987_37012 [Smallanthus sonchifolius]|uniref:Uncharacterized protein n=1 Tax=Smallanthus sonchifolius TaxID=185202 RepID=A0ACB9HGH8_9ASTR|nr:hypothetical protein L1987_37012 [Smallanthus sonchifolius]